MGRTKKINKISNEAGEYNIVVLEESLTIWNAAKIKESLAEELKKPGDIKLNFSKSEEIDFSFLQLLYSFVKTAETQGKKITLENRSPVFDNLINNSGLGGINHPVFQNIK